MAATAINEALLNEFRLKLMSLTNRDPAGPGPFIPSVSPQTPKPPTGPPKELAKQLHNTADYKMKK